MKPGLALLAIVALLCACDRQAAVPQPGADPAARERGRTLLAAYGCVACHHIKGMDTSQRTAGPPLNRIADNSYIAGVVPNNAEALARWIMAPRRISPGTAMPDLGVSAEEARAMAVYLYSQ